jgi:hypothetical protein
LQRPLSASSDRNTTKYEKRREKPFYTGQKRWNRRPVSVLKELHDDDRKTEQEQRQELTLGGGGGDGTGAIDI